MPTRNEAGEFGPNSRTWNLLAHLSSARVLHSMQQLKDTAPLFFMPTPALNQLLLQLQREYRWSRSFIVRTALDAWEPLLHLTLSIRLPEAENAGRQIEQGEELTGEKIPKALGAVLFTHRGRIALKSPGRSHVLVTASTKRLLDDVAHHHSSSLSETVVTLLTLCFSASAK